ncbi:hypothetical protein GQX74_005348 [Glossina fuscipes]|nr:hypothetical protein GQX74_005348 [Glossina fuscipes]
MYAIFLENIASTRETNKDQGQGRTLYTTVINEVYIHCSNLPKIEGNTLPATSSPFVRIGRRPKFAERCQFEKIPYLNIASNENYSCGGWTTHNDTTSAQIAIVHFALTHAQGIVNGRNATENNGDDGTVMRTYPALAGVVKLTKTKTVKYPGKAFTSFVSLRALLPNKATRALSTLCASIQLRLKSPQRVLQKFYCVHMLTYQALSQLSQPKLLGETSRYLNFTFYLYECASSSSVTMLRRSIIYEVACNRNDCCRNHMAIINTTRYNSLLPRGTVYLHFYSHYNLLLTPFAFVMKREWFYDKKGDAFLHQKANQHFTYPCLSNGKQVVKVDMSAKYD